jgi:hypothetical protein
MKKPLLRDELPGLFLRRLDPKLIELYMKLAPAVRSGIASLVNKPLPQDIHPNRILKYAFLYVIAKMQAQGNAVSKDHAVRAKHELAGKIHGMSTGYRNLEEARRRYRLGRQARQQIKASLEAVVSKWRVFEDVVQEHRSDLPKHLRSRVSKAILRKVGKALQSMGIAIVIDEEDLVSDKGREREISAINQTYIWWQQAMAPYRGKWNDMHQLAYTWRMSSTQSVKQFKTIVSRICKRPTGAFPFDDSLESVLSEK